MEAGTVCSRLYDVGSNATGRGWSSLMEAGTVCSLTVRRWQQRHWKRVVFTDGSQYCLFPDCTTLAATPLEEGGLH